MMRKLAVAAMLILACGVQKATAENCSLTITSMNFGTYTGTLLNGNATGTVNCDAWVHWTIPLDAGTGKDASETTRKMTGPGGVTMDYRLFTDAARTNNWGNTPGNEQSGYGDKTVTVYGLLPGGQVVAPGTYTDTMKSATTTFIVSVVIEATCTITAGPLAFGNYSGAQIFGTSVLTVNCTNLAPFDIGLDKGTAGATVTTRKMTGPASSMLSYSLSRDGGPSSNWGNTVGTDTLHKTGTGSAATYNVYGSVPAGQSVTPGNYTDTIVATVTY